jgi:serine/threonine protein phosphatase PrpC
VFSFTIEVMQLQVWGATDVGLRREINQDTILVDQDLGLYIVADGMGGHRGGEVASAMAVETVREIVSENNGVRKEESLMVLVEAYKEASKRIFFRAENEQEDLAGMGTTMVGFWMRNGVMYIANVGDSRLYMWRPEGLWQLTEDHSLINDQIRAGVISEEEAPHVVGRNVITRSVGFEREVQVDTLERVVQPGEVYVLCSDGLSGLITDQQIADLCKKKKKSAVVTEGISMAKKAGGDDNISAIVVEIQE